VSSAVLRKSITDLTRRKARTAFTVLTLALAVASIGLFAVPAVMEQTMKREAAADRVSDLTVSMEPLALDQRRLSGLAGLPNVNAVEPRSIFATRVFVGERRDDALLVGVADFDRQDADIVSVETGELPRPGEVLTDNNNAANNGFDADAGDTARIVAADGSERELAVSGGGSNLTGADQVVGGFVVLYTDAATVARLSGADGYTSLGFRLEDNSRAAAEATVATVREQLRTTTAFTAFDDLPVIQEPGGYPGKEEFDKLGGLLNVVILLALLTALVLIANTMSTLVGEQTREIAAMKAIGAGPRDIRGVYLRTTLLFGLLGAVIGVGLGVLLTNLLVGSLASFGFGVDASWGVSVPVLAASFVLGLIGPPLAALPAIRRAARLPLNEALRASGSASGSQGRLDTLLRRASFLPRTAQIGLRGLGRRKRRSVATALQVALAVATLLALLSLGAGVGDTTRAWFDQNRFDIWVQSTASKPFGAEAQRLIRSTEGVGETQPWIQNSVRFEGEDAPAWGLPEDPMMRTDVTSGRWYSEAEVREGAEVAVLGKTIAGSTDTEVGDEIRLGTSAGPASLQVIGISGNQAENGGVVFVPVTTLQSALGSPGTVNSVWVATASDEQALIDRTTTRIEDRLAANGNQVSTLVNYDAREKQVAANATLTTSITVLGMLIVAISMVGLINAITMAVLERTREVGMLRSIGARGRDVRRIFLAEGLAVALLGWLLGVPLGWLLARGIGWLAGEQVGLDIAFVFPLLYLLVALVGTVLLALLVMFAPLRRAVRLKPGEAIRHT
jgi:putative ABC transport system permease protein